MLGGHWILVQATQAAHTFAPGPCWFPWVASRGRSGVWGLGLMGGGEGLGLRVEGRSTALLVGGWVCFGLATVVRIANMWCTWKIVFVCWYR